MNIRLKRQMALALCAAAFSIHSMAHTASPYILPEVFDSKAANLSLQSAISVEKFYVASRNFKTDYVLTRPDASQQPFQAAASLSRMNVAEVELPMEGTYRIRTANSVGNNTEYALLDGRWLRIRAPRINNMPPKTDAVKAEAKPVKPEGVKAEPPRFVTPEQVPSNARRMTTLNIPIAETFVTKAKPSALPNPTGQGLELKFVSHPNQLFVGDDFKAQVLLNGKAIPHVEVDVFKGAGSYELNAKREQPHVTTNANGEFSIALKDAGIYLVTFAYPEVTSDATQTPPQQSYSYGLTFEVTE